MRGQVRRGENGWTRGRRAGEDEIRRVENQRGEEALELEKREKGGRAVFRWVRKGTERPSRCDSRRPVMAPCSEAARR